MADFPTDIWLRDPIISGKVLSGGGLNRGMALLKQARDEITAIETALGTDPAGSATDLVTRLAKRLSPSGIPRGRVYGMFSGGKGWFSHAGFNIQFGYSGPFTAAKNTITYPTAYSSALLKPTHILVKFVAPAAGRCGDCQLLYDTIGQTTFKVYGREWSTGHAWVDAVSNWYCHWVAVGGS